MKNTRNKKTKFYDIEVLCDSEIRFIYDKSIKARVVSNNRVFFKGNVYSLSRITIDLLKEKYGASKNISVNGFQFWLYQDELLSNRRTRLEKEALIKELQKLHKKD